MEMYEVISWLRGIEDLAARIYHEAAERVPENPSLSAFLQRLARDEERHREIMDSAAELLKAEIPRPVSVVKIDAATRDAVETPLKELRDALNDLRPVKHVRDLPLIWKRRFLVVDDEPAVLSFLSRVLEREGMVEIAADGREALEKTRDQFYNVVILDVNLPVMNAFEFYEQAMGRDSTIGEHVIFFTGLRGEEVRRFCQERNVPLLEKPAAVHEIREAVRTVIERAR